METARNELISVGSVEVTREDTSIGGQFGFDYTIETTQDISWLRVVDPAPLVPPAIWSEFDLKSVSQAGTLGYQSSAGTISNVATNYGFLDLSADSTNCGNYVAGEPSNVQYLHLMGGDSTVTGGQYKLRIGGEETSCIEFDALSSDIEAKLSALDNIGDVYVLPTQSYFPYFPYQHKIVFDGVYPQGDGSWPTLEIVESDFGQGACTAFAPVATNPYSAEIHSNRWTGACAAGVSTSQTIVLEAESAVSGYFSLSYKGIKTQPALPVDATAAEMAAALPDLQLPAAVSVSRSSHGMYGYALMITFEKSTEHIEKLVAHDDFVVGLNSPVNNYDTVVFASSAEDAHWTGQVPMSGEFRIYVGSERTAPLSFDATNAKLLQELLARLKCLGHKLVCLN